MAAEAAPPCGLTGLGAAWLFCLQATGVPVSPRGLNSRYSFLKRSEPSGTNPAIGRVHQARHILADLCAWQKAGIPASCLVQKQLPLDGNVAPQTAVLSFPFPTFPSFFFWCQKTKQTHTFTKKQEGKKKKEIGLGAPISPTAGLPIYVVTLGELATIGWGRGGGRKEQGSLLAQKAFVPTQCRPGPKGLISPGWWLFLCEATRDHSQCCQLST